jgi:hypothetical protein
MLRTIGTVQTNKIWNNVEKKATQLFLALSKHLRVDVRFALPCEFAKLQTIATFSPRILHILYRIIMQMSIKNFLYIRRVEGIGLC